MIFTKSLINFIFIKNFKNLKNSKCYFLAKLSSNYSIISPKHRFASGKITPKNQKMKSLAFINECGKFKQKKNSAKTLFLGWRKLKNKQNSPKLIRNYSFY
jgi:hypothetical protein